MDTAFDLKSDEWIVDGRKIQLDSDLKDLPEIDYNDPEVIQWMAE